MEPMTLTQSREDKQTLTTLLVVIIAILLWGVHGEGGPLQALWPSFVGPGLAHPEARPRLIPGVLWDQELISFVFGLLVAIALPVGVLTMFAHRPLARLGLSLPPPGSRKVALALALGILVVFALPFAWAARSATFQAAYPLYRAPPGASLLAYELSYLLFFISLDGLLRGVLLFGLLDAGAPLTLAIGVETLVQATWHLGKPLSEALGSPLWGIVGGLVSYRSRSVWPIVLSHWLLNVMIDVIAQASR
jgi:hypothetical protein